MDGHVPRPHLIAEAILTLGITCASGRSVVMADIPPHPDEAANRFYPVASVEFDLVTNGAGETRAVPLRRVHVIAVTRRAAPRDRGPRVRRRRDRREAGRGDRQPGRLLEPADDLVGPLPAAVAGSAVAEDVDHQRVQFEGHLVALGDGLEQADVLEHEVDREPDVARPVQDQLALGLVREQLPLEMRMAS